MTKNMTPKLNKQLDRFQASAINTVFSLANRLKAEGKDIVDLSIGEPDFDTPEHVKQAAIRAIQEGDTKYTPSDGSKALKQAIVRKLKRDNNLTYKVEQIAVFLEKKSGRLAEITATLAAEHINIRALSVADTADFGSHFV